MKRTTIFLKPEQLKALARVAKQRGFTVAQVIRLYVSEGLRRDAASK